MFKFLKKKIKDAVGSFSKSTGQEEVPVVGEESQIDIDQKDHSEEPIVQEVSAEQNSKSQKPSSKTPQLDESTVEDASLAKSTPVKHSTDASSHTDMSVEEKSETHTTPDAKTDAPKKPQKTSEHLEPKQEVQSSERPSSASDPVQPESTEHTVFEEQHQEIIDGPERVFEEKSAVHKDLLEDDVADATKKKRGMFSKLKDRFVKFQLTDEKFEELFWEFELALLENGLAVAVIDKVKHDLHEVLTAENVTRKSVEQVMLDTLKSSLAEVLDIDSFDLIKKTNEHHPLVIAIVGVNGSGKTTSIGKLIRLFQNANKSVVVAAADTFRAAAIQQLEEHTNTLGVKLIKHDYGSDPAAVAFDAVKHAKAKGLDVVLIDTAGRLQSNSNLMDELRKVIRTNKPDLTLFVGEAITGNDCVEQAQAFNDAVGIDGLILSKADIDEKGGAAISVSYVTKKPILYLGTGQTYDDLIAFDKEKILDTLGL